MPSYKAVFGFGPYEGDIELLFQSSRNEVDFRDWILDTLAQIVRAKLAEEMTYLDEMISENKKVGDDDEVKCLIRTMETVKKNYEEKLSFLVEKRQVFGETGMAYDDKKMYKVWCVEIKILQF